MLWVARWQGRSAEPRVVTQRMLLLTGILFLLSPVGDPWYLCWVVPFLCLHPWRPWILLTGLIPLYYLGFFVEYHFPGPQGTRVWTIIKLIEYVPFYGLLLWETVRQSRHGMPTGRQQATPRSATRR